ncbi:hypothetical protein LWX53_00435 [bacterium]|nr:hypothetical protein [bacterium]
MIVNTLCAAHAEILRRGGMPGDLGARSAPEAGSPGSGAGKPADPWPTIYALGARKAASCLESAKRFSLALDKYRAGGKERLAEDMREEKRRLLKFAYSVVAASMPAEQVRRAFASAGFIGKAAPQEECEAEILIAGVKLALKNAHPIVAMRAMTAYLGFSVFDDAEAWILEHFGDRRGGGEELIIPGDLPDMLIGREASPGAISQAARIAGPQLVAACLAGCPKEAIDYVLSLICTPVGAILLDGEIRGARNRLSSEELSDAQSAFLELLSSIGGDSKPQAGEEGQWSPEIDRSLVADVSALILELDEHLLKTVLTALDPKLLASLMQAMEPMAHDRLLSTIAPGRSRKVLDALERAVPLSNIELTRSAQLFAQRVLAELAPKTKPFGKSLSLPARLRQILTSILSRE